MAHYKIHCEGGHVGADIFGSKEPELPPVEIKILAWTNTGQVQLTGPLNDKELCIKILEAAKEQILKSKPADLKSLN